MGQTHRVLGFLGTFFFSEPFCFNELQVMTPSQTHLSPFLLLYLISCCVPSLLHAFKIIHVHKFKEIHRSYTPGPLGTQVAWNSDPAVEQPLLSLEGCVIKARLIICKYYHEDNHNTGPYRARQHHAHTDNVIVGQKVVKPLKCNMPLALGFSTAPFFPILHGTYCGRTNQGLKICS